MRMTRRAAWAIIIFATLMLAGCFTQNEKPAQNGIKVQSRGFASVYGTMFVRGTNNGWGTLAMGLISNNLWSVNNVKYGTTSTERFKFDAYGNWAMNFGLNGVQGGSDIFVTPGKTYDITFNDSTKKYTITESIVTKCDVTVALNDITTNAAVNLAGSIAKLTGTSAADVTLTSNSALIAGLAAGNYTLTLNTTVKVGMDEYKVSGIKAFTVAATDKNISITLDVTKEILVKGTADISINVIGATITDFMILYNSDNSLVKVYKDGTVITAERIVNSVGFMNIFNLLEGSYKVAVDYNSNGKKYTGETTFAISKAATTFAGILNVTYTENKVYLKTYPTMNFRGTPNGWGNAPMALTADYTWSISGVKTGTTASERFKFDVYGDWKLNFGLNGGIVDIPLEANTTYDISFNDATKKYTVNKQIPVSLTLPVTNGKVKKGDTTFSLPTTGTYTNNGISTQVNLTWTPILDVNKVGDTTYTGTANGLNVTYTLNVWEPAAPTLTISTTSAKIKKGDAAFALPLTGTYTKDAVAQQVNLAWEPALDITKLGDTVYTGTANGLNVTFTLTVVEAFPSVSTYPTMNLRGTPNNWGTSPMTLTADYTWSISNVKTGNTTTERIKFDVKGDWSINFGLNGVLFGKDIMLDANSTYNITFNDSTKAYTLIKVTLPTLTIPTTSATVKKGDITFALPATGTYTKDGAASQVNLTWTPALDTNKIGDTLYTATVNGLTVTFALNVNTGYVSKYPTMYFRGTPNNWGTLLMTLVRDYVWQTEQIFNSASNERFKFDVKGDWTINFGDSNADGIADLLSKTDIYVKNGAGKYNITFDERTNNYYVDFKPDNVPVVGIAIDVASVEVIVGSFSQKVTAQVLPVTANNQNVTVYILDPAIATINGGVIQGVKEGVTTLVAKTEEGGFQLERTIKVLPVPTRVTGVSLNTTSETIEISDTTGLNATVLPANATNKTVMWVSSDLTIATVKAGVVSGLKAGVVTISAITVDGGLTTAAVITVLEPRPDMIFVDGGVYSNNKIKTVLWNFEVSKYEVTQNQYKNIVGNNPSFFKGGHRPVETVEFKDIVKYINLLNAKYGYPPSYNEGTLGLIDENGNPTADVSVIKGYRVGDSIEWEYAARGGKYSHGYEFSGSAVRSEVAWNVDDGAERRTYDVGLKKPNELGIYDMSGNVWEKVHSKYDASVLRYIPLIRGGGWEGFAGCYVENEQISGEFARGSTLGIRLFRTIQ